MKVSLISAAILGLLGANALAAAASRPVALHCGHVFDANTGKIRGETTILIENNRITSLQDGHVLPETVHTEYDMLRTSRSCSMSTLS